MTIETKYNVGDMVWTNMFRGGEIVEVEIEEIKISVRHPKRVWSVNYLLRDAWFSDEEFEPTKEQLIKSL